MGVDLKHQELGSQLEDYKRYFDLPKEMLPSLGGVKDAREEENVNNHSPGAGLSPPGCFDVLQRTRDRLSLGATNPVI